MQCDVSICIYSIVLEARGSGGGGGVKGGATPWAPSRARWMFPREEGEKESEVLGPRTRVCQTVDAQGNNRKIYTDCRRYYPLSLAIEG